MRIAVRNRNSKEINVSLKISARNSALGFIGHDGSNLVFRGALQDQEQKEQVVKVFFPFDYGKGYANDTLGKEGMLVLLVSVDNQPDTQVAELPMGVAPIPAPRLLLNGSLTMLSGFSLWFIKEWWDVVKKELEKQG